MRLLTSMFLGLGLLSSPTVLSQASAENGTAILAGGCFWCVESDFDHVKGVTETTSGYIGGKTDNPTYKSHGKDGHLEAVKIVYDKDSADYRALLDTFWRTIDVLDDTGQFCDKGNSYRTAVFVANDEERAIAEASKAEVEQELGQEIKTRILDAAAFWPAEDYHQDYYEKSSARYNYYRKACGRDKRVKQVWGETAYLGVEK
ncbi:peptide-methionine (S)-S-oxide reductase MsrA [Pararhizobium sp. IMCC21322]|uniref:peptide-methionine (S)-S-oxide reductase MsrA n=1 Tax=Pararhizobium sp. IMCC21322 TaxID=3067903 RepID=UPI002740673A|nr:peptide-methionine (S)-S-oxide reductase MsrA [Pararhizobium sp. IMCC21322]